MNTPMGTVYWDDQLGMVVTPARIESPFPNGFRLAVYPDGGQCVQAAYTWSQGNEGGIVWRDLPVVPVNEQGQEII